MPEWLYITLLVITSLIQLIGLVGLLLVFFPGLTVIWLGQLVWAIIIGFNHTHESWQFAWTVGIFGFNTLLMIGGSILDNFLMAGSAYKKGTPWWAIALTWLAMIGGGILLTPIGGLALAFLAMFLLEYFRIRDQKQAFESTKAMAMGCGWAVVIRLIFALLMIGLWVIVLVWI